MLNHTSGFRKTNITMKIFSTRPRLRFGAETSFYFGEYCTATTEDYKVLEQYGVTPYEIEKVNISLDGIKIQTS